MVLSVSLRAAWSGSALPAVIVPDAVGAVLAAETRGSLERAGYTRYALLDRGRYDVVAAAPMTAVADVLAGIASEVTGRALAVSESRALRLGRGDYLLTRHDRVHDDRPVEVVLDLSAEPVPDAFVHYRHRGQVFFAFPSTPGALAIVERGPTVMCNHAYVSRRWTGAPVVRLIALLRERP